MHVILLVTSKPELAPQVRAVVQTDVHNHGCNGSE
jgi:hypothetical protein